MKDIRVIVRIKNNRLLKERERRKYTQAQMGELCEMSQAAYGDLENLKHYPVTKDGEWSKAAQNIALVLDIPEYELFPEAFKLIKTTTIEREVGLDELPVFERLCLESPDVVFERKEMEENVHEALSKLTPREQYVLKDNLGFDGNGNTLRDTGHEMFITQESVRQIKLKALRKLRHHTLTRKTKDYI